MNDDTRRRMHSVCEQCQTILRQAMLSVQRGQKLDSMLMSSEVRDLDQRIGFVLGELEMLKTDTGFDPTGELQSLTSAAGAGTSEWAQALTEGIDEQSSIATLVPQADPESSEKIEVPRLSTRGYRSQDS